MYAHTYATLVWWVVKRVEWGTKGLLMKHKFVKIFLVMPCAVLSLSTALAHTIGGAYASQVSCTWGQFGNQYGYIGTYNVNGQMISQFFGNTYCPY